METGIPVSSTSFFEAFTESQPREQEQRMITDDEKIFSLSKNEGWPILKQFIMANVEDLRSRYAIAKGEALDVYATRRMAQDTAINHLEAVIGFVDNIAEYVQKEDEKRKQAQGGESAG
jgi:hypothetical protein